MKAKKTSKQVKARSLKAKTKQSSKKAQKKPKTSKKKISLKEAIDKVVDAVKKPFSKQKDGSQQKKSRHEKILVGSTKQNGSSENSPTALQQPTRHDKPYVDVPFAESTSGASYSKFFYSNKYALENFDDPQLYKVLSKKYPGLLASEESEVVKRNAIISLLNDVDVMQTILKEYNMTVLDFFKFLFRLCPSVFKGLFVKKVQKTIKDKPYAQSINFGKYRHARKGPSKRCSIF